MSIQIKQNGQWVSANKVWIKHQGVWKQTYEAGGTNQYFINTPTIVSPTEGQVIDLLNFESSVFSGDPRVAPVSSFWELAADPEFTTIEKSQQFNWPNDIYNWSLGSFDIPGGIHYVRVKYSGKTFTYDEPVESSYSLPREFDFQGPLPPFVNGSQTFTTSRSITTWTVPARIYRLRVEMYGSNGPSTVGGYVKAEFDVTPGEVFYLSKGRFNRGEFSEDTLYFGKNVSGDTSFTASDLWVMAGSAGGQAYATGEAGTRYYATGGNGGGNTGGTAQTTNTGSNPGSIGASTGGTQSSGGVAGANNGANNFYSGQNGSAYFGGNGARATVNSSQYNGGAGGPGFYGGGGGSVASNMEKTSGGGGGSNGINIPSGRNVSNTVSEQATSDGNRRVILTW